MQAEPIGSVAASTRPAEAGDDDKATRSGLTVHPTPRPHVRLPWPVVIVAAVVIAVNVVLTVAGGRSAGLTIDEAIHVDRMNTYLADGWYMPPFQMHEGAPLPSLDTWTHVYGPATAGTAHLVAVALGAEDLGTVSASQEAYEARRLLINGLGFLALFAVAAIVRVLLGSWRWGVLAAAILSAIPMWTGQAMFNIKDVAVATGYTLVTAGLVGVLLVRRRAPLVTATAVVAGGVFLSVGTRPGMWVGVALSVLALVVGSLLLRVPWPHLWRRLATAGAGLVAGGLALVALYPNVFGDPLTAALRSAKSSADFPSVPATLVSAGQQHSEHAPWWYIPAWLGGQLPTVVLILALVGLVGGIALLVRQVLRPRGGRPEFAVAVGLLIVQAAALPLAAAIQNSVLYNGVRQVLFVVPALAALAAVALWAALATEPVSVRRPARLLVLGLACLGLVLPTVDAIRLFPYGYAYFNEIATLRPITTNWATDYWAVSRPELDRAVLAQQWPPTESRSDGGNWNGEPVAAGCAPGAEVTRPLHGQDVLMLRASRCPLTFHAYPAEGLDFRPGANGAGLLVGEDSRGSTIGLVLPGSLRDRALRLTIDTSPSTGYTPTGARPAHVSVNGVVVGTLDVPAAATSRTFDVPVEAVTGLPDGQVVVRLVSTEPDVAMGIPEVDGLRFVR